MFEFVRQHTKIMMGLMFLLIIPSFVLFGIDGYTNLRGKGEAVALVGGQEVTQVKVGCLAQLVERRPYKA